MRPSVSSGRPSSRMKPALRYSGRAPLIARSLTVPLTASVPISPPGKISGLITNESVVKARRQGAPSPPGGHSSTVESPIWASRSLPSSGSNRL